VSTGLAGPVLRSKLFWVGVLYFAQGLPFGIFYDVLPVWFRQQGVDLRSIGALSLLGLAWTLKFLWAPAVDHYRHHRIWMAAADLAMGAVMLVLAMQAGLGVWTWVAIAAFTILSATNDIAIDGYTIEYLDQDELGLANGIRIGLARVGLLTAGMMLVLAHYVDWRGAFLLGAMMFVVLAVVMLTVPKELPRPTVVRVSLRSELRAIIAKPRLLAAIIALTLGVLALVYREVKWLRTVEWLWPAAFALAVVVLAFGVFTKRTTAAQSSSDERRGPMFGALFELLSRPAMIPVALFVLTFKLGDASMGFMVKPFWVDRGFTPAEIGMVSVNVGLGLSILGGLIGGWYVDRVGVFRALWVLGLWQAASNLGYVLAATYLPTGGVLEPWHRALLYSASAGESLTGGLGTGAFLAFLMSIVDKERAAAEYALLSSLFALTRSLAGWASGFGAESMGYAHYFLLTFFLSFPAYALLPWVRAMLARNAAARLNAQHVPP
jgi:MFS transporter, PAT family, beta-lactamase induction signal transducer AmpG